MSLINCPECNKEISDKAKRCPNCGMKIRKKMASSKCIIIGSCIFFLDILTQTCMDSTLLGLKARYLMGEKNMYPFYNFLLNFTLYVSLVFIIIGIIKWIKNIINCFIRK